MKDMNTRHTYRLLALIKLQVFISFQQKLNICFAQTKTLHNLSLKTSTLIEEASYKLDFAAVTGISLVAQLIA